jgi:hypothetical protein
MGASFSPWRGKIKQQKQSKGSQTGNFIFWVVRVEMPGRTAPNGGVLYTYEAELGDGLIERVVTCRYPRLHHIGHGYRRKVNFREGMRGGGAVCVCSAWRRSGKMAYFPARHDEIASRESTTGGRER